MLTYVPASSSMEEEVAEDLKAIFKVRREKTARALAEVFVELYRKTIRRQSASLRRAWRRRSPTYVTTLP